MFTTKELNYLLKLVRDRIEDVGQGLHRYFLNRTNKSLTQEELLPQMKEEQGLLTSIRNKLWRIKRNGNNLPPEP